MVTGIVIPHETMVSIFEHDFKGLADYQAAVGGYIEAVYLDQARMTIFANEEGKVHGLPINRRATCLWWLLYPEIRGYDMLVGDVVLIGSLRGHGSITEMPEKFAALLLRTDRYKVEVRTIDGPKDWSSNEREFDNYFEAAIHALNLQDRSTQIQEVRVAPA